MSSSGCGVNLESEKSDGHVGYLDRPHEGLHVRVSFFNLEINRSIEEFPQGNDIFQLHFSNSMKVDSRNV